MVATSVKTTGQGRSGRALAWLPDSVGASAIGALVIVVATLVLYWPSFVWMAEEWSSENALFTHGYLIAAIAIYLVGRSILHLADIAIAPQWPGLLIVIAMSGVWLLGSVASVVVVHTSLVPLIALAAIYATFGLPMARRMAFPLLFICFALPAWQYLQPPFRDLTIFLTDVTVRAIGIPVEVSGNLVHLPDGSFRIVNGCSGINFIVVGLALSTLYGHLYYSRLRPRIILILTALALAMITNWVRVVSLTLIGNATKMQSELVYDHANYGWWLFAAALVPLFLIARRLESDDDVQTANSGYVSGTQNHPRISIAIVAAILALAVAPVWAHIVNNNYDSTETATINLPAPKVDWSGPINDAGVWFPAFAGPSGEAIGRYDSDLGSVWLYQNIYLSQEQDRELIHMFNNVTGNLSADRRDVVPVIDAVGFTMNINSQIASRANRKWLIWSWYRVGSRIENSELKTKAIQSISILAGSPESGLTAVAAMCENDCQVAASNMADFVKSGTPLEPLDYKIKRQEK